MKRVIAVVAGAGALLAQAGAASADGPDPNGHNCAGVVVSALAGPGLGAVVSGFAQAQQVDNLGLANCGEPPRQNP